MGVRCQNARANPRLRGPSSEFAKSSHAPSDPCHHPHRRAAHNLDRARRAAQDARVWAVVKANAYGHGIERVFDAFRAADGFALLDLAEAERVRTLGWRGPILLLEGVFEPRDLELCSRLGLWHTVHCDEQIDMLAAPQDAGAAARVPQDELGHEPARLCAASAFAPRGRGSSALPQVDEITLMTHFSDADGARGVAAQLAHVRARHARPAGRALGRQQRRHAAPRGADRGPTGSAPASCCTAARPTFRSTTPRTGSCGPA